MICIFVRAMRVAPQMGPQCAVGSGGNGFARGASGSSGIASGGSSGGVSGSGSESDDSAPTPWPPSEASDPCRGAAHSAHRTVEARGLHLLPSCAADRLAEPSPACEPSCGSGLLECWPRPTPRTGSTGQKG
eukprot:7391955-Prymnesium_polylepis.2